MEKRIKKAEGFQTVHYTVGSKQIPKEFDGYRIAHLSDLHGQAYGRDNKTLVSKICGLKPDMIAMTGDMADQGKDSIQGLIHLSRRLGRLCPVYYIPGNHEQELPARVYAGLAGELRKAGVMVLENQKYTISKEGALLRLYGLVMPLPYYKDPRSKDYVRGIHFSRENTRELLGNADPRCCNILLAHNPLYYPSYRDWGADLTLSGHIHGGIIRIPGLGGVLSPDVTLFPKYDGGHFEEKGRHLIVSRGLGNHFLVRVFNPPELVCITLRHYDN
ncbi:MAG: metallophosphoesterase [Hungatella sp.]|nr:metallophosphoesterase [Hungatella sp.]